MLKLATHIKYEVSTTLFFNIFYRRNSHFNFSLLYLFTSQKIHNMYIILETRYEISKVLPFTRYHIYAYSSYSSGDIPIFMYIVFHAECANNMLNSLVIARFHALVVRAVTSENCNPGSILGKGDFLIVPTVFFGAESISAICQAVEVTV